jgi:hypothetical protein
MGEVRGLFGDVPQTNEPVPSCVEGLRNLLEQAEAGELVGFAYGAMTRNGNGQNGIGGMIGGYAMLGALELVKVDLINIMTQSENYE